MNPLAVPTYPELCLCPTPTDFLRVPENEHHTTGLVVSTLLLVFIRHCSLNSLLSLNSPFTPTEPVKHGEDHTGISPKAKPTGLPPKAKPSFLSKSYITLRWGEKKSGHFQHQPACYAHTQFQYFKNGCSTFALSSTEKLSLRIKQFSLSY